MDNTIYHRPSPENATPSFRDMLIEREKTVKQLLAIYVKNLNRLEIREAEYGVLDVPTRLSNEIEHTHERIDRLMKELQGQEGILPVLKALSQSESIDRQASDPVRSDHSPDQVLDQHLKQALAPVTISLGLCSRASRSTSWKSILSVSRLTPYRMKLYDLPEKFTF